MSLSCLPCLLLASCVVEVHDTSERVSVQEPFDRVVVALDSGDVTLNGGGAESVTVRADLAWVGGACPTWDAWVEDGTLYVEGGCQEPALGWCAVDIQAELPAGLPVEIRTGSGDVGIEGLGSAQVETGSGDVEVLDGAVAVDVESGSGDLVVEMAAPFDRIEGRTGSGDVDLTVPAGAYVLDLDTGSGGVDIQRVACDSEAVSLIRVRTGSGDITLTGR
ncbi:MAG: DUF4097 family beta strand repeat protein [Deltaproteobacteria bacterium]|nr:DUF4097 family beta strand repeat protein [Deltaproteobacteria bacterium]